MRDVREKRNLFSCLPPQPENPRLTTHHEFTPALWLRVKPRACVKSREAVAHAREGRNNRIWRRITVRVSEWRREGLKTCAYYTIPSSAGLAAICRYSASLTHTHTQHLPADGPALSCHAHTLGCPRPAPSTPHRGNFSHRTAVGKCKSFCIHSFLQQNEK